MKPAMSWGIWGEASAEQRACGYSSYGLKTSLPAPASVQVIILPDGRLVLRVGTFYMGLS